MEAAAEEFQRCVRPQWKRLHLVARRYVASEEDARDLVQETMLRAWRSFSLAEEHSYSRSWLFVIMRSAVIDWQRTANRRVKLVPAHEAELTELAPADLSEPFPALPAMDETRFREFLDDRIAAALETLEPAFREVIVLSVLHWRGWPRWRSRASCSRRCSIASSGSACRRPWYSAGDGRERRKRWRFVRELWLALRRNGYEASSPSRRGQDWCVAAGTRA